jgi:3-oxoacyl-[acyl-carrier protein] reductase
MDDTANSQPMRTALVTGASRGIGAAIADSLVQAGIAVVGTSTSDSGAEAVGKRLQSIGGDAGSGSRGMVLDVGNADSIGALSKALQDDGIVIGILVNNAGITSDNLLMRMKDDAWDDVLNTNLTSVFKLARQFSKGMMKLRWGRIVNISSVVARMGNPGQANYSAAKAGLEGLSRSMAKELGSRNITVNCVAPGFIETDMTAELSEEQRSGMQSACAIQRLGRPDEIAALVAFLCSESAAYITGETIHVNGGLYMS